MRRPFHDYLPSTQVEPSSLMKDNKGYAQASAGAYVALETPTAKNRLDQGFDHADHVDASTSKQEIATDGKLASFGELFSYADRTDKMLMAGGTLAALTAGVSQPIQIVLFGDVLNSFNPAAGADPDAMRSDINSVALKFTLVGVAVVVLCFLQISHDVLGENKCTGAGCYDGGRVLTICIAPVQARGSRAMAQQQEPPPEAVVTDFVEVQTPKNRLDEGFDRVEHAEETKSKQEIATDGKLVSMSELFSFADTTDKLLMTVGLIGALAAGVSQPAQIVLFGNILNTLNPSDPNAMKHLVDNIRDCALNFVYVGIAVIVCCFIQVTAWSITASRQAKRIRSAYVNAILTKEIGWFDVNEPMQLATKVADSTVMIQQGMGRKVGDGLHFFSMAVSGITIGFVKGWQLTLVLLAFVPLITLSAFMSMKVLSAATQGGIESYGKAGAVAQEALSNVRTVHMFNSIKHFVDKYEKALEISTAANIRKGFAVGWGTGIMFFMVLCTYAGGMYFGAYKVSVDQLVPDNEKCTGHGCYDGGRVLTVFFCVRTEDRTKSGSFHSERSNSLKGIDRAPSQLSMKEDAGITEAEKAEIAKVSTARIWKMSLPEWKFMVLGTIGAIVNAAVFPVWGLLLTKITVLFFKYQTPEYDPTAATRMRSDAKWWSVGFFGLGVVFGLSITMQHFGFAVASQRLVTRVRLKTFKAMLHQDIGWFDLDENSSGALVSRLASDSAILQAMTSETLNQTLVNLTSIAIALGIAFYNSWQMTLLLFASAPVLLFNSYIQAQQMSGTINNKKNNDADTAAGSLLSEAIGSIRTVASFSMEKAINTMYVGFINASKNADIKVGIIGGLSFGISQGTMFFNLAFLFYIGGKWISNGTITFENLFTVMMIANDQIDGNSCTGSGCYDGGRVLTVFFCIEDGVYKSLVARQMGGGH
ncbi:TPA: hypothetical protein N0F65_009045 [Lagenidium giganteum]|uniref:ABC transmembrane type-1 domain-containing protein n=1 Tax=Lagenidium giganteum TaxID=4803 RepID=A0AAV2YUS0_9STRA|nr:TPA: hypothetical protein N0F65_009045 [Lagenidium giganteum]